VGTRAMNAMKAHTAQMVRSARVALVVRYGVGTPKGKPRSAKFAVKSSGATRLTMKTEDAVSALAVIRHQTGALVAHQAHGPAAVTRLNASIVRSAVQCGVAVQIRARIALRDRTWQVLQTIPSQNVCLAPVGHCVVVLTHVTLATQSPKTVLTFNAVTNPQPSS